MDKEQTQQWLAARTYLYTALHLVFGAAPKPDNLRQITGAESLEILSLFDEGSLAQRIGESGFSPEDSSEELCGEYTRLFEGPEFSPAPPWSSCYRMPSAGTIFNPVTLSVRSHYRAAGFLPKDYPRVADDHIAIMFDFLSHMSQIVEKRWSENGGVDDVLKAQMAFIKECMLPWVGLYAEALRKSAKHSYYPVFAQFVDIALKADAETLREHLAERV